MLENQIIINNTPVQIKEYNGVRVVTLKDIDTVHGRPDGTASRNFKANRDRFIENEDYFIVKPSDFQKDEFRPSGINNRGTILITESGYLMLVKSFTDDLAWQVQRQLVNCYFRVQEMQMPKNPTHLDFMQGMLDVLRQQDARLKAVEDRQDEQNHKIQAIHHVFADNLSDTFEDDVKNKVNAICQASGKCHSRIYAELYHAVNKKAGCDIKKRQQNIINRKMQQGYSKTAAINTTSQLTVIAADKQLKNFCQMVLKELCAEYLEF